MSRRLDGERQGKENNNYEKDVKGEDSESGRLRRVSENCDRER